MNKKPREKSTEKDLTVLLKPEELMSDDPEDCFGREWDPRDKDCSLCHDVEICGIVRQADIQKAKKKIEREKGPFLDETAFEKVPVEKLVETIRQYAEDDDPALYEEIEEAVEKTARTKDKVAIREYITRLLPRHNLQIIEQNGEKIIVPNEESSSDRSEYPITPEDAVPGS